MYTHTCEFDSMSYAQAVKVTHEGIQSMLRTCGALELLSLSGCDYIGTMDLRRWRPLALLTLELSETYTTDDALCALLLVRVCMCVCGGGGG